MSQAQLTYQPNTAPSRGLAATGIFFVKVLLAVPHLLVIGALQSLAQVMAYIGFWVVAFTGRVPAATQNFVEMTLGWSARAYGWLIGFDDAYPQFDTDAPYSVSVAVPTNEEPSKGWAVAGLLVFPKLVAALPHFVVLAFLALGAVIATWIGYWVVLFTGQNPRGLQDFVAGVMQWGARVAAWFAGLTDEYPPFALQ